MQFTNPITVINTGKENTVTVLLVESDSSFEPGKGQAINSLANSFAEIKEKFPEKRFQFIPYITVPTNKGIEAVTAYFAVEM